MPGILEKTPQPRAESGPGGARSRAHDGEERREQNDVLWKAGERGIGGDGAERDDPALGVDPLERGTLEEGERAALLLPLLDRARSPDRPGEIEEIRRTRILQQGVERGIELEDGAEPDADEEDHQAEAERDAQHMRQRAREAEVQPRGHQHDVVRPRREQHHGGEKEEGGEKGEGQEKPLVTR